MTPEQTMEACSQFLIRYSNKLSNDCCNDFNLEAMIPNVLGRRAFVKEYYEWNGDLESFDPEQGYAIFPNFAVVALLAHKLDKINPRISSKLL